jgi:hypothetical protein
MYPTTKTVRLALFVGLAALALGTPGEAQVRLLAPAPRLDPVAETKLLMEGLAQSNFQGLEKLLRDKPTEAEAWTYARGQALLIAETGNLLMLRPPRNAGQNAWLDRAAELRTSSARLARTLAQRDYEGSRAGLREVANSCNRCHQSFRVPARVAPFAAPARDEAP